ncbi:MAG: hypothetical protein ACLRVT_08835 [Oscillospiraceae bacterium]
MGQTIWIVIMVMLFLLMMGLYRNLRHPGRTALLGVCSGTAGLLGVHVLGIGLAVNGYTLFFSCVLGLPGVIMMLVLKLILQL